MIHSRGLPNVVKVEYNFLLILVHVLEIKHMKLSVTRAHFTVIVDLMAFSDFNPETFWIRR